MRRREIADPVVLPEVSLVSFILSPSPSTKGGTVWAIGYFQVVDDHRQVVQNGPKLRPVLNETV